MKACVLHRISDLRYEDVADPAITDPEELIVRIERGGICGSDMHYYREGGIGDAIRVREPIVIGHEGTGIVEAVGDAVDGVAVGDRVAIRPARPCGHCPQCRRGMPSYCENMRHLGSAMTLPHVQGLFCEKVLVHRSQVRVVNGLAPDIAAFAEPLAVAYHGVHALGDVVGRDVLVMGAGPIGALCAISAKVLGADSVTVVDVAQGPLEAVRRLGIEAVCNSLTEPERIAAFKEHRGRFDRMIEASGNARAVLDGMAMVRPEGIVAQVGTFSPGKEPTPGPLVAKGLQWRGVFRFYDEFGPAVNALRDGLIDPRPLLTHTFAAADCAAAMETAIGPDSIKVQVEFA
jgi:L-idonate 5-dehydrogenase